MENEIEASPHSGTTDFLPSDGASCSRLVLQRRYLPSYGIPKTWTEWHDHPEPHQIAWGPGQHATLEENMKAACEGYYSLGQGCEFRMVSRTDETLWEYSANAKVMAAPLAGADVETGGRP